MSAQQRCSFANFLLTRSFSTDAVLRLCRFPTIATIQIESSTPITARCLDTINRADLSAESFSNNNQHFTLFKGLNYRYLRLYVRFAKNTWQAASTFEQLRLIIRVANGAETCALEKNRFSHLVKTGDDTTAIYDITLNSGLLAPEYLRKQLPIF